MFCQKISLAKQQLRIGIWGDELLVGNSNSTRIAFRILGELGTSAHLFTQFLHLRISKVRFQKFTVPENLKKTDLCA